MPNYAHPPPPPPEQRHPLSNSVRTFALSLPGAWEDHPWGDIIFKTGDKMFCGLASDSGGVTVKANPGELESLLQRPGVTKAAYVGRYGWISVTCESELELDFVKSLVQVSYELVAAKQKGRGRKAGNV